MDNYFTLPIKPCVNLNHMVKTFCLPEKVPCDNTIVDGLFSYCGEQWNCNKKCAADKEYFITVPPDGKIMFQTNFRSPKNPDSSWGWGAAINLTLHHLNDTPVLGDHTDYASRWVVGHSGKHGYQTIEIDFDKVPITCGYFKILYGDGSFCTQHFKIEECACLVEIEGVYKSHDCWGNYYGLATGDFVGTGDFKYSNKIYLEGSIKYFGSQVKGVSVTETIRFTPKSLVAPYMEKYISRKILNTKQVIVDGETYNNGDNVLVPREKSSMFWPILEFSRKGCDSSASCLN